MDTHPLQPSAGNKISELFAGLSATEQVIARYCLQHSSEAQQFTTRDIAEACGASAATVSRFARRLGYLDFNDLRDALIRDTAARYTSAPTLQLADLPGAIDMVLREKHQELLDTAALLDTNELTSSINILARAQQIQLCAVGNTIPSAQSAAFMFSNIGLRAHCALSTEAMTLETLSLGPKDAVVFLSKSGHSKRLLTIMNNVARAGVPTIVLTNRPDSPLAQQASCVLHAATRDRLLNATVPFSHNSINFIIELLFLLLCSEVPDAQDHAGLMWANLGDDKGLERELL